MRKTLIGLLIAIIIFILLLPYYLGEAIATEFKAQLQNFNKSPDAIYASVINYQTHWFTTDATVLITQQTPIFLKQLNPQIKWPAQIVYQLQLTINHGPFVYINCPQLNVSGLFWTRGIATGTIKLISPKSDIIKSIQGLNQPIKVLLVVDMNGALQIFAKTGSYQLLTDQLALKFLGAKIQLLIDNASGISNVSHLQGKTIFYGLEAQFQQGKLIILPASLTYNYNTVNKLWLGKKTLTIPAISLISPQGKLLVSISNVNFATTREREANTLTVKQLLSIDHLIINNNVIKNIQAEFEINNVKIMPVIALQNIVRNVKGYSPQKANQNFLIEFAKLLTGVNVQLNYLQANFPFGTISMQGILTLPATVPVMPAPAKLKYLFNNAVGQLQIKMPITILQPGLFMQEPGPVLPVGTPVMTRPNFIDLMSALASSAYEKNYLIKENGQLIANLDYNQGALVANNIPVDFKLTVSSGQIKQ
ncbi:MAG: hypothetical protein A3E87_02480 [Gammaproteobacteria bacterium RIFCSPHIGHO2_12_FULL_35_23]|nr:MAG: hypothetical protein A3E87_02480 [Gammaproteobacteria bacterium RIFCSPHIGHO2_12_FULL_35_23]